LPANGEGNSDLAAEVSQAGTCLVTIKLPGGEDKSPASNPCGVSMFLAVFLALQLHGWTLLDAAGASDPRDSWLYAPAFCLDDVLREPAKPYVPHPGDIFLATDEGFGAKLGHRLAFTGPPQHSGIVFARPDGTLAILEGGPHNTLRIQILEPVPHLQSYACIAKVYIRERCTPLSCEESARLTCFAMAQCGKRFALARLGGQLTPLRSRGPVRTYFMGGPHGERRSYFCSELVMEACVAAGLLDPARIRPAATYPRDIFFGDSLNPFLHKHLDINAGWLPPARCLPTRAHTTADQPDS
jgi:hypothetical protein